MGCGIAVGARAVSANGYELVFANDAGADGHFTVCLGFASGGQQYVGALGAKLVGGGKPAVTSMFSGIAHYAQAASKAFPQDPLKQLRGAVEADDDGPRHTPHRNALEAVARARKRLDILADDGPGGICALGQPPATISWLGPRGR